MRAAPAAGPRTRDAQPGSPNAWGGHGGEAGMPGGQDRGKGQPGSARMPAACHLVLLRHLCLPEEVGRLYFH